MTQFALIGTLTVWNREGGGRKGVQEATNSVSGKQTDSLLAGLNFLFYFLVILVWGILEWSNFRTHTKTSSHRWTDDDDGVDCMSQ